MFVNYLTILLSKRFAFYRGISGQLINGSSQGSDFPCILSDLNERAHHKDGRALQCWPSQPQSTCCCWIKKFNHKIPIVPDDCGWGEVGTFWGKCSSSRQDNKTLGGDWTHWREHISISHISSTIRRQNGQISSLLFCIVILWWVLLYSFERHFARIYILPHTL